MQYVLFCKGQLVLCEEKTQACQLSRGITFILLLSNQLGKENQILKTYLLFAHGPFLDHHLTQKSELLNNKKAGQGQETEEEERGGRGRGARV